MTEATAAATPEGSAQQEDPLRRELERSIRAIIDAVGGEGTCVEIGYARGQFTGFVQHEFYPIVRTDRRGAVLGSEGSNAERMRVLVRTRARVFGSNDRIEIRVFSHPSEAPPGVFPAPART